MKAQSAFITQPTSEHFSFCLICPSRAFTKDVVPIKGEGIQCIELPSLTVRECVSRRLSLEDAGSGEEEEREKGLEEEEV